MAKKHVGRFVALAAIAAAAAAGVSYFLQYKSFHKELDEDFHDFEDDFDDFKDTEEDTASDTRNYVSLTPDKKDASDKKENAGEPAKADGADESSLTSPAAAADEDSLAASVKESKTEMVGNHDKEKSDDTPVQNTTVTVEEITE